MGRTMFVCLFIMMSMCCYVTALTPPSLTISVIKDSTGLASTIPIAQGVKIYTWVDIINSGETPTTVTCKWLFEGVSQTVYKTSTIAAKSTTTQACRTGHIFPVTSSLTASYIISVSITSANMGTTSNIVSRTVGTQNYGTCVGTATSTGICMASSTCSSEFGLVSIAGQCPGATGITCCPILPLTKSPCSFEGRSGTCVHSNACSTTTNTFKSGVCQGATASANSVQCCIPNTATVTNSCANIGGVCMASGSCSSPSEIVSGYCSGTNKCCVGNSAGFKCASRGGTCQDETLCDGLSGSFMVGGMCPGASTNKCCSKCGPYTLTTNPPEWIASPNFVPGRLIPGSLLGEQYSITFVVLHGTAGGGTVSWFQDPTSSVSAHYVVELSGRIVQMVSENDTAWHNGVVTSTSLFYTNRLYCPLNASGNPSGNPRSIGIEIERSVGNDNVMPEVQIKSVSALVKNIMDRRPGLELFVHNQFNVGRICPGSIFPLDRISNYQCIV